MLWGAVLGYYDEKVLTTIQHIDNSTRRMRARKIEDLPNLSKVKREKASIQSALLKNGVTSAIQPNIS